MSDSNNENLNAAHDFRAQQQKRYSTKDPEIMLEQTRKLLPAALRHLQIMFPSLTEEELENEINKYPKGETPHDERTAHAHVQSTKEKIEAAAKVLNFNLRDGVSLGALDGDGYEAMQQRVMLTDASVILVTSNLLIMINRLAKLLALSIPIRKVDDNSFEPRYAPEECKQLLLEDEELQHSWTTFFADYAMSPLKPYHGKALYVFGPERQTLWDDISEAIHLFVVGHEYGHHIDDHRLGDEAGVNGEDKDEAHRKEVMADILGCAMTIQAGRAEERHNWCALANVGAMAILIVLELIRRGNRILSTGEDNEDETRDTHPPLETRLEAVNAVTKQDLNEHDAKIAFVMQNCIYHVLFFVWGHVAPFLKTIHENGTRPAEVNQGGWLPS